MEAIAALFLFLFIIALRIGFSCLIAWGLQWVLIEVLHHDVPFIPVLVGVFLLSFIFGGSSSSSK